MFLLVQVSKLWERSIFANCAHTVSDDFTIDNCLDYILVLRNMRADARVGNGIPVSVIIYQQLGSESATIRHGYEQ